MLQTQNKNPVEQRLMVLADHWTAFRNDQTGRLLVWQADANALRFYQCFFEVQKHPTDYTVGDLFIVFDTPFENTIQYSRELKVTLAGQYAASREDLIQQGIEPDWPFDPEMFADSAAGFVRSLLSFRTQHHERIGHLVAVLMPVEVADNDSFVNWLTSALNTPFPERLRLVAIESRQTPRLGRLDGMGNALIRFDAPPINALTTAQETFAQEAVTGPAGVFRNLLIGLMTLVEEGNAEQVKVKAADALTFARRQGWADQEVVIAMLVAGAMLKEKRFQEALKGYQCARQAAEQSVDTGHPAGRQLVLQSWFGQAGVHLAAGEYEKAVPCYDQAAALAQQLANPILAIEAFRMGAYCLARLDDAEPAIRRGWRALEMGQKLKPDARAMTTLPIAAIDILRVTEPHRVANMEHIKYRQQLHIHAARHKADQAALELGNRQDPLKFRNLATELEAEIAQAKQTAARQLDTLAAAGSDPFRQVFSKSREMLGAGWPLDTLAGVPVSTRPAGDATP